MSQRHCCNHTVNIGDHTTMPIQLVQLIPNAKVIPKERLKLLEMIGKGKDLILHLECVCFTICKVNLESCIVGS